MNRENITVQLDADVFEKLNLYTKFTDKFIRYIITKRTVCLQAVL